MTDPADIADSNDSTENADPMLNADAKDPTDPTDKAEPTEPMDRTEPRDPMDKTESCDHKDHFDDGLIGPFSMPTAQARRCHAGDPHRPPVKLRCRPAAVPQPVWHAEPRAAA
jgi:hypothetical protein